MKMFNPIMVKLVDANYYQSEKQIKIVNHINIALNLPLLDIKSDAIDNTRSFLQELMKFLGGYAKK